MDSQEKARGAKSVEESRNEPASWAIGDQLKQTTQTVRIVGKSLSREFTVDNKQFFSFKMKLKVPTLAEEGQWDSDFHCVSANLP